MTNQLEYNVVLASDKRLYSRVEHLLLEKEPIIIRVDGTFRHQKAFIRYLKFSYEGVRDVSMWWYVIPLFHARHIVACMGAKEEHNYSWRYEYTPEGVDLIFTPPNDVEAA